MNTQGLLYKNNFNTENLVNPTLLYMTPNNAYVSIVDIYVSALPALQSNITLYISNMKILPSNQDIIVNNLSLSDNNGTIIINDIKMSNDESLFIFANTTDTGGITVQVRGRTELIF